MKTVSILFLFFSLSVIAAPREMDLGVVLRFGDKYNTTINQYFEGIQIATDLFEKENRTRVHLIKFSHDPSLKSVSDAADKVVSSGVRVVVGPESSTEAIALSDKLSGKNVVVVTPTATLPELTHDRPFVYRVCFSDDQVADKLAEFVVKKLHPTVIGVFKNISIPYSNYLGAEFSKKVMEHSKRLGKPAPTLVQEEMISGSQNFSDQIDAMKAKGVTLVANFVMDGDFAAFVSLAGRHEFFPTYVGSDSWGSNEYVFKRHVKESLSGNKFVAYRNNYWKEDEDTGLAKKFRRSFVEKFHKAPNAFSAIAFDAAWVALLALKQAKDPNSAVEISTEMKKFRNLELVTSDSFSFEKGNSPKKSLHIYRIDRSGVKYEATLK